MPGVSRHIYIEAPPHRVYDVVSDFAGYPDFLPDVKETTLMHQTAKTCDVEFVTHVMKDIRYSLRFTLRPPHGIQWHLLEGELMQANDGEWMLEPKGKGTQATYTIEVQFGALVPKLITNMLVEANLPDLLRRVKERAESHQ